MAAPIPSTEKEAVNAILRKVGHTELDAATSLSGTLEPTADRAYQTLLEMNRAVQSEGWWFNMTLDLEVTPSGGEITFGNDVFEVRPSKRYNPNTRMRLDFQELAGVQNGSKLWNVAENSYTWGGSIRVDKVESLKWLELPEEARRYIFIRAARAFSASEYPDMNSTAYTAQEEEQARRRLEKAHKRNRRFNIFNGYSAARPLLGNRPYLHSDSPGI